MLTELIFTLWGKKRLLNRAATAKSLFNATGCYAANSRPFLKRHGNSVKLQATIIGSVICLIFPCRPSDISGSVVTIVVDPVKRMITCGAFSNFGDHIVNESRSVMPWFIEGNASSSIAVIKGRPRVQAAITDMRPKFKNIVAGATMRDFPAPLQTPITPVFSPDASARSHTPALEITTAGSFNITAITETLPFRVPLFIESILLDYGQAVKFLPCQRFNFGHLTYFI